MDLTHAKLVQLLGEIDGISLESETTPRHDTLEDVVVYLEIGGQRVELIRTLRTGEGVISHHITRSGIAGCLVPHG